MAAEEIKTWTTKQVDKAIDLATRPLKQALFIIVLVFSMLASMILIVTYNLIFP